MKISEEFDRAVAYAREEAMRTGCTQIGADHLMLGLLRLGSAEVLDVLRQKGIEAAGMKSAIEAKVFQKQGIPYGMEDDIRLDTEGNTAINLAIASAQTDNAPEARPLHLLHALCCLSGPACSEILREAGAGTMMGSVKVPQTQEYLPGEEEVNRLLGAFYFRSDIRS